MCISGLLHVGDEVLEVEGRSVTGKTPDEVVQMLVSNYLLKNLMQILICPEKAIALLILINRLKLRTRKVVGDCMTFVLIRMRVSRQFCQRGFKFGNVFFLYFFYIFLYFFFFNFLVDEGRGGSNTTISWPSSASQRNAI